jgi:hypothetical protein
MTSPVWTRSFDDLEEGWPASRRTSMDEGERALSDPLSFRRERVVGGA